MYRKYFVVADPAHKQTVHQELTGPAGTFPIPERSVECIDAMSMSDHSGVFLLTDNEASALKTDPRLLDVHLTADEAGFVIKYFGTRTAQYDKNPNTVTATAKNWGLVRCISTSNNFGTSLTATTYTYNLTGKGVDIVMVDTGVEPYHPEFSVNADGTGGTRVVDHDWTQYGVITSVPTGGFLGDMEGHGSNCASIAAGNTNGWAPDAAVYSLRISGGNSISDNRVLGGIDDIKAFQTIKLFHQAKPVDPNTGYKRPTIVNASYGYTNAYNNMSYVSYRGTIHAATTTTGNASLLYGTIGVPEGGGDHGVRYTALEVEVASAIAAGVVVVGAAGNSNHKIDVSTGADYNNFWVDTLSNGYYYHRGSAPTVVDGVICVGATSWSIPEHKVNFSETGPRVDVYSPGLYIAGAWSATAPPGGQASVVDIRSSVSTSSGATFYFNKLNGTSMASPQVAGLCALFLELRPNSTPAQVRNWVTGTATLNILSETAYGQIGTYTNFASLQGGGNRYAYMPFKTPNKLTIN